METGRLAAVLRRVRAQLEPLRGRGDAVAAALDLLERDLLPRSAGGDAYLVAGIVGPNNAGKSALFNALVGRPLSPSVPAGGATRRLVGAAHPDLLARLRAEPTLARFRLRSFAAGGGAPEDALQPAADPAELLVAAEPKLPGELMLIDTPDFDSVLEDNRLASESLLAVADLVIAVVTRHSYQNRAVVLFLERWFGHGRPWMLVYNEAIDEAVARAHAAKLVSDVGTPPLAAFWAPHDLEVQRGHVALDPQALSLAEARPSPQSLRELLFDLRQIAEVKSRAFAAAVARLRDALDQIAEMLVADAAQARAVLAVAETRAFEAGIGAASAAMPAEPFITAFRTVLDRRSNVFSRGWRAAIRQVRLGLESLPALLRGRRPAGNEADGTTSLAAIERAELRKVWPAFWEDLVRDLGPEARHVARRSAAPAVAALLDADLSDRRRATAQDEAERVLAAQPAEVDPFRQSCEALVEEAIERRGFDLDIQAAADIATLMPVALAAAVIVKTGGLGSDIAVAGGGAISTFLFEKYAHLLGSGITAEARRRWSELRGRQLARLLIDAALPDAASRLRQSAERDSQLATELRATGRTLS